MSKAVYSEFRHNSFMYFDQSAAANTWATVSLRRRFFQLEDQQEGEKEKESIREARCRDEGLAAGDNVDGWTRSASDPVISPWARSELTEFRRSTSSSHARSSSSGLNQPYFQPQSASFDRSAPPTTPSASLDHPDLRVSGMFLPQ